MHHASYSATCAILIKTQRNAKNPSGGAKAITAAMTNASHDTTRGSEPIGKGAFCEDKSGTGSIALISFHHGHDMAAWPQ